MLLGLVLSGCGAVAGRPVAMPIGSTTAPTTTSTTTTTTTTPPVTTTTPTTKPPATRPARTSPTGFPTAATTGVIPGTKLTVVTGDQTFATDGQVIEGKDFRGFVRVTARNVTFRNCVFRGRVASGNAPLLDTERGTKTVVEDSEFVPSHPAATIDGLTTRSTTILRANIHGSVDGVKANSGTLIQDSYIHDMAWFASDPNQGGGPTHNDGVQSFAGESGITLRHNTIDLSGTKDANAALQSSARDTIVDNNLLDGGGCILNFDHKSLNGPLTGLQIVNNRFGPHSAFECPILLSTQSTISRNVGNVWADTGQPIPPPQVHD
ncbi:MAG TPA: hypothetical protein VGX25_10715 [Actinophytocola sp.]|uniref:hypothetical protein n=1 Tax=Actinophytocola sp. TaxID=1872138 RepID=UPI002DDD8F91|nr:hypothetical protein [Actinophytocola sp.]HEV2779858.1 hypothetical protein [Actinophytocola sp.]